MAFIIMKKKIFIYIKILISALCIIAMLFMIVTMTAAGSYSVLAADDFSHAVSIGLYNADFFSYLKASFTYAVKEYRQWQGTYFSMFIQALLSPINNFGTRQLRVVMTLNAISFFAAVIWFVYVSLKSFGIKDKMLLCILGFSVIFSLCGYEAYPQIFFWFSGATSYSFPLTVLLIGLSLSVMMREKEGKGYAIACAAAGLIAMGGSLAVAGAGCYAMLLFCVYDILKEHRIPKKSGAVFLIYLAGAVINAAAPGNYLRYDMLDDTGLHPFAALSSAFIMTGRRWQFFLEKNFVLILMIVFICGIAAKVTDDVKCSKIQLLISAASLIAPVAAAFPVALGYSSEKIPNRCAFVIDAAIILSAANLMLHLGIFTAILLKEKTLLAVTAGAALICAGCLLFDGYGLKDVKILDISGQLRAGIYQDHYYTCKDFLKRLGECEKGTDLKLSAADMPYEIDNCYNFYLIDDPDFWVNRAVADYYGFKGISVQ